MQYFAGTREVQIKEPTAVTIGKFDGLHRGHTELQLRGISAFFSHLMPVNFYTKPQER